MCFKSTWSSCQFLHHIRPTDGLNLPKVTYLFNALLWFFSNFNCLVISHRASLLFHSWPQDSCSTVSHLVDGRLGLFPNPAASKEQKRPFYDTMTNFNLQQNSPEFRVLTVLMMSCPVQMITSAFPASRVTCSAPPPRERDSYWFRHTTGPFAEMASTRACASRASARLHATHTSIRLEDYTIHNLHRWSLE